MAIWGHPDQKSPFPSKSSPGLVFLHKEWGALSSLHSKERLGRFRTWGIPFRVMRPVSHLSRATMGALGGLSAPFFSKKDMASSTERIVRIIPKDKVVRKSA